MQHTAKPKSKQKTIFKKYLRVTLAIVLVSFFFLGMVMLVFVSYYWQGEKRQILGQNAKYVAGIAAHNAKFNRKQNAYVIEGTMMQVFIPAFSANIDADIFVTDDSGNRVIGVYANSKKESNEKVPDKIIEQALRGKYQGQGTFGGAYDAPCYVVGVPILVSNKPIGAVFAASSIRSLNRYRKEVLQMFLLAAIAAFMISFCVVWLFSYKMVKPLRQMAIAAKNFGDGDFSTRVTVNSNDEIGELALAFNNMANSLASGESMRRNFIANVSHELKTPMTTIAGFIDGILDGTIAPEQEQKYLRIVSQEVKRLSRLVRTMLDLSRIDSGELKIRPARFDLTGTILEAMLSFEKPIEDKKIEIRGLENVESLYVNGDPDMIHQVVYNLIENAVKFTNSGGYIQLGMTNEIDRTTVKIRNSGQGIAPDEIAMIFDRFYKTDKSRSQDKNGMGLGLYIVRTIIRLHGGEINVSSVLGEYTEFSFWLPKIEEDKQKENVSAAQSEVLQTPHKKSGKKRQKHRTKKNKTKKVLKNIQQKHAEIVPTLPEHSESLNNNKSMGINGKDEIHDGDRP